MSIGCYIYVNADNDYESLAGWNASVAALLLFWWPALLSDYCHHHDEVKQLEQRASKVTLATVGFAGDKELITMQEKNSQIGIQEESFYFHKTCFGARIWIQIMCHEATSSQQAVCKIWTQSSKKQQIYHNFTDLSNLWRWLSFSSTLIGSTFMAESRCKFVQLLNENWPIEFCWSHDHWKKGQIFPIFGDRIITK